MRAMAMRGRGSTGGAVAVTAADAAIAAQIGHEWPGVCGLLLLRSLGVAALQIGMALEAAAISAAMSNGIAACASTEMSASAVRTPNHCDRIRAMARFYQPGIISDRISATSAGRGLPSISTVVSVTMR